MIKLIRFLLPFICLLIILNGCSKTENKEMIESTNDSKIEKSELDYQIVKGKVFHILVDEYLETNDPNNPNVHVMFREYRVYDGNKNNIYLNIDSISLPKEILNSTEAKKYLQLNHSEWLRLKPLTIIGEKVVSQWKSEEYQAEGEYWSGSPMGLTFEKIIHDNSWIFSLTQVTGSVT